MRSTPLLVFLLPLWGVGLISWSVTPEVLERPIRRDPPKPLYGELPVVSSPIPYRTPVVPLPVSEMASMAVTEEVAEAHAHPKLPEDPLLEECASPSRFSEWYRGTPNEQLITSLVRIQDLLAWDPHTCACQADALHSVRSREVELVHQMREQVPLLRREKAWLEGEVRRLLAQGLEDGVYLEVFLLPHTKEDLLLDFETWTKEDRALHRYLLTAAVLQQKELAIDAEFDSGRYRVDANPPNG